MKITEITISAGQIFPHPYEQFANFRPQVTLKATIGPDENIIGVSRELMARAEGLVREQRDLILRDLREALEKKSGR